MKKLIAISVVFALIAGTAFAADVGVDVFGNVKLIQGDTNVYNGDKKADAGTGYEEGRIRMESSGENDDGTFGGWVRFQAGSQGGSVNAWGYGWWKPIEQVRFLIGSNGGDNFFGAEGVTGWNFYQVAGDVGVISNDNVWGGGYTGLDLIYRHAFYGGWDNGALITITPMEPLEINIGIPYGAAAKDVYPKTTVQVAYAIENIGKLAVTYVGGLGHRDAKDFGYKPAIVGDYITGQDIYKAKGTGYEKVDADKITGSGEFVTTGDAEINDPSKFFLYFNLTAVENLSIDIGFGYTLAYTREDKVKIQNPIAAGLGVTFTSGDFGVKARTVASFMGSASAGGSSYKYPLELLFDVLPFYAVNENLTVNFSIGVGYQAADDKKAANDNESQLAWHAEPYISLKGGSTWFPNFYAGIRLETNGLKKYGEKQDSTNINWGVPIGIAFSF